MCIHRGSIACVGLKQTWILYSDIYARVQCCCRLICASHATTSVSLIYLMPSSALLDLIALDDQHMLKPIHPFFFRLWNSLLIEALVLAEIFVCCQVVNEMHDIQQRRSLVNAQCCLYIRTHVYVFVYAFYDCMVTRLRRARTQRQTIHDEQAYNKHAPNKRRWSNQARRVLTESAAL